MKSGPEIEPRRQSSHLPNASTLLPGTSTWSVLSTFSRKSIDHVNPETRRRIHAEASSTGKARRRNSNFAVTRRLHVGSHVSEPSGIVIQKGGAQMQCRATYGTPSEIDPRVMVASQIGVHSQAN